MKVNKEKEKVEWKDMFVCSIRESIRMVSLGIRILRGFGRMILV